MAEPSACAWHQMIEIYLQASGVAWTNLHPDMFTKMRTQNIPFRGLAVCGHRDCAMTGERVKGKYVYYQCI
jgi:hypothetical protein